jgi:hypothetical protein
MAFEPLDPERWSFNAPKSFPRDLPDPPGYTHVSEKEESITFGKSSNNNKEILEKVCILIMNCPI